MHKSITHAFNMNLGMMIDVISIEETFEARETGMEPIYIIKSNNKLYPEAHWLRTVTKLGRWIDYHS